MLLSLVPLLLAVVGAIGLRLFVDSRAIAGYMILWLLATGICLIGALIYTLACVAEPHRRFWQCLAILLLVPVLAFAGAFAGFMALVIAAD